MANLRSVESRLDPERGQTLRGRLRTAIVLLFLTAAANLVGFQIAHVDGPDVYAIKDARIAVGTGRMIEKGNVVVRDGLIAAVGEAVAIPGDARVIEGSGLTVYPGLIDGFGELGIQAQPSSPQRPAGGGPQAAPTQAAAQRPQPERVLGDPSEVAADQINLEGPAVEGARAVGITAAVASPRQGIFAGQSTLINLAGASPSRAVVKTPVGLTIQFTTSAGFFGLFPNSLMGTVAFIRQSFYDASHYREQIARYERVKRGIARPAYDRKLEALQPALRGETPVAFLANSDGDIRRALMIADEFKLKPIIVGALYGYRIADLLKSKNVPVVLSVDFPTRRTDLPEDEDEPLRVLRERAEVPSGAARLAQAGVKFSFTSASLRPADFMANVRRAIENGLAKDEALRALTINAADIAGAGEQLGTVEEGKIANLVVTSGDLFAQESRVRHLFIDGREIEIKPEQPARREGVPGARPGAAADPAGEWALTVRSPQGDVAVQLSLHRDGDRISGSMSGPTGTNQIDAASITGNELRFSVSIQMGADTMQATVTGTIEGDSIRGVIMLPAMGSFEFTGSRPR